MVSERSRITGRRIRRHLVSMTAMVSVAAVLGGLPAGSTVEASAPLSAPVGTPPGSDVPTLRLAASPPVVAPRALSETPGSAISPSEAEAAAPAPQAVPMDAAAPTSVRIPAIGVDSTLVDLGLQPDGALEVPPSGFPAGWYTGAPTPGELGPAIITGHVDWGGQPGVFFDLRGLSSGDEISVTRQDGSTAHFRVTRVESFAKDEFPTQAVYGDLDHAGLRLITCDGDFDRGAGSYVDNLVVFAELI